MIKNFNPQPYEGLDPLPDYVTGIARYTLEAVVPGGYRVVLARLAVGESKSGGNTLTHVLFESYTDHGDRRKATRTRTGGYDREFIAVKNAMSEAGIEFHPSLPCSCEVVLQALGEWYTAENPELSFAEVVSQTCH